ncbi:MAG: ImuA family protein [Phycisphaerae bacterium]
MWTEKTGARDDPADDVCIDWTTPGPTTPAPLDHAPRAASLWPNAACEPVVLNHNELLDRLQRIRASYGGAHGSSERCPSGLAALDAALDGGFWRAAVHELLDPSGAAAVRTVALRVAAHAAGAAEWILWLDAAGDFYPPPAAALAPLGRLIVVRARAPSERVWVCEQALRCRAVAAVVAPLSQLDAHVSRRLQVAAEIGGGLGLLLRSDARPGHTFAAVRLRFDPLPGATTIRRAQVTVLKLREGKPARPFVLELPDAADSLPAYAAPRHRAGPPKRAPPQQPGAVGERSVVAAG